MALAMKPAVTQRCPSGERRRRGCTWLGRPWNERKVTVQTRGCSELAAPSGVMVSWVWGRVRHDLATEHTCTSSQSAGADNKALRVGICAHQRCYSCSFRTSLCFRSRTIARGQLGAVGCGAEGPSPRWDSPLRWARIQQTGRKLHTNGTKIKTSKGGHWRPRPSTIPGVGPEGRSG